VPRRVVAQDIALGASKLIQIGPASQIIERSGAPAAISNVGTQLTMIGPSVTVGSIYTQAFAEIGPDTQVTGSLVTGGGVNNAGTVTGQQITNAQLLPADTSASVTLSFTTPTPGRTIIGSGQTTSLAPGAYDHVSISSGGTLKLIAGTYSFNQLDFPAHATIVADTSGGTVRINVLNNLTYAGHFSTTGGGLADVVVGYLGTFLSVDTPFLGTLIAPNAYVVLGTATGAGHQGAFFAQSITLASGTIVTHIPIRSLVRGISIDKQQVCSGGDTVKIHVNAVDPVDPSRPVTVLIDGAPGSSQFKQLTLRPGPHPINVTIVDGAFFDSREIQITAADCGQSAPTPPILRTASNLFHEGTIEFSVANGASFTGASYAWDFGDGTTAVTSVPYVTHDYRTALPRDSEFQNFTARVTVTPRGSPPLVSKKTLAVYNLYAVIKQLGRIRPPVTPSGSKLQLTGGNFTGSLTIQNPEDTTLNFTSQAIEYQPCDPDRDPFTFSTTAMTMSIPAHASTSLPVSLAQSIVPADVCSVAVHLTGTAGTMAAGTDAYFDVRPNPQVLQPVTDAASLSLLNNITSRGLTANKDHVSQEELYTLFAQGQISQLPSLSLSLIQKFSPFSGNSDSCSFSPAPGCACTPGDPTPTGLSCQAQGTWKFTPARIANALKGDILVEPGGCGNASLITGLLHHLNPPQKYSHEGLMTRSYYQLRQTTAASDRYFSSDSSGRAFFPKNQGEANLRNGIREDVLRFGWQGSDGKDLAGNEIPRPVEEAFNSFTLPDPETGVTFTFNSFSPNSVVCDSTSIDPLVIQPPPGSPSAVRDMLKAADNALNLRTHYRFFAYSQANISTNLGFVSPPTSPSIWSRGSSAAVSSTFIWTALKQVPGLHLGATSKLTNDPKFKDFPQPDPDNDGLFIYPEDQRRAVGNFIADSTYNQAFSKLDPNPAVTEVIEFFTVAAGHISRQVTNCFSKDDCGNTSDQDWLNPGTGSTVSPDNFLFWASPAEGGVYGYADRLAYRGSGLERDYQLAASAGTGTIQGHVTDSHGNPLEGARVSILSVGRDTATDKTGFYKLQGIPAGTYGIAAQWDSCAGPTPPLPNCTPGVTLFHTPLPDPLVTVPVSATVTKDLQLISDNLFRTVTVTQAPFDPLIVTHIASVTGNRSSGTPDLTPPALQCSVDPMHTTDQKSFGSCEGDGTWFQADLTCQLQIDQNGIDFTPNVQVGLNVRILRDCTDKESVDPSTAGRNDTFIVEPTDPMHSSVLSSYILNYGPGLLTSGGQAHGTLLISNIPKF